jgi:hypothetical protein
MSFRRRSRIVFAAMVVSLGLVACDTKVEPVGDSGPATAGKSETVVPSAGGGIGKARENAKGIERQADEYNRRLEEEIEKMDGR